MNVRFYIDQESGEPHIAGHGVTEEEVRDVLARPLEDRPGREGGRVALGQTRGGRYLRVIYVPGWLQVVPWAELAFGSIIDRVGPLLLRKQKSKI